RHAVEEAVDDAVGIVVLNELLNRRRFREQVTHGNSAVACLCAPHADGDTPGRHRIGPRDDDRMVVVQPFGELSARRFPIEQSLWRRRRHGAPGALAAATLKSLATVTTSSAPCAPSDRWERRNPTARWRS